MAQSLIVLGMLVTLSLTCSAQIDLGMKIAAFKKGITDSSTFISISRSDIKLRYKLVYNKIHYDVTLNKDRRIDYMGTSDINFVSPEGVTVNSRLGQIEGVTPAQIIADERWWTRYLKLKSGWYAAFKSDGVISKDSQVLYFFKKKF